MIPFKTDMHWGHIFNRENEVLELLQWTGLSHTEVIRSILWKILWNIKPVLVTLDDHADCLVFMIQLTVSTCMFVDIVLNIFNRCHTSPTIKLHKATDGELFYLFSETIRSIICLNSRFCCPHCWLPIEKVPAVKVKFFSDSTWQITQQWQTNQTECQKNLAWPMLNHFRRILIN